MSCGGCRRRNNLGTTIGWIELDLSGIIGIRLGDGDGWIRLDLTGFSGNNRDLARKNGGRVGGLGNFD